MRRLRGGRPSLPAGQRIYAVGDVHGRLDLLSGLLLRIENDLRARPAKDPILVFLGDYIDRGPQSRQVIDKLIELARTRQCVFLKGNHEEFLSKFLQDAAGWDVWVKNGGREALESYGLSWVFDRPSLTPKLVSQQLALFLPYTHRKFLSNLKSNFSTGDYFFVHAGVKPGRPLAHQNEADLFWIRDEFLSHRGQFEKMIVHGHTPVSEPDVRPNRINIDTGAFMTGRLTCLKIEGESIDFV